MQHNLLIATILLRLGRQPSERQNRMLLISMKISVGSIIRHCNFFFDNDFFFVCFICHRSSSLFGHPPSASIYPFFSIRVREPRKKTFRTVFAAVLLLLLLLVGKCVSYAPPCLFVRPVSSWSALHINGRCALIAAVPLRVPPAFSTVARTARPAGRTPSDRLGKSNPATTTRPSATGSPPRTDPD